MQNNKTKTFSTAKPKETAILISVIGKNTPADIAEEHLEELAFLVRTAGAVVTTRFIQRLEKPDLRTYVGKGKLEEIVSYVKEHETDLVVFDDDLQPSQVRNLEQALKTKILDRSLLILDIFSLRARTARARTQVELAQYEYMLPRLTNMWTHLSKQKGGIGMKGPGETELETDRRIVRDKIALLKKKLAKIDKQALTQRKNRDRMVRVTLVGYTNVGKSTLMRLLAKADVFAENKLFATVDSTVRKVVIGQIPFLLTDTVGFIRKLPHGLIESFKSTLDEIREADILVHVVDISSPAWEEQYQTVMNTLAEIDCADKTILHVYNKIDRVVPAEETGQLPNWVKKSRKEPAAVYISAYKKINLDLLRNKLLQLVKKRHYQIFPNYLKSSPY
ncbi:MAG TPA: GTPase HflX [Flammeovirgaceae bacterium]|nr:GTPase HflX [Flammeovirgaceae bacterium]